MPDDLQILINAARGVQMSPEDQEEQRRSFAYGNSKIENERITRQTIDEQAEILNRHAR
ncbi:MAG: hypothetical protein HY055_17430 [Magnetospirillum sp.]|nr:hypothetical protein [Magnetospirillum sp.]